MLFERFSITEQLADPFGGEVTLDAKLSVYIGDNSPEIDKDRKRPLVLICPGGAYAMTSDREAEPIALQFLAAGIHAAVLRYTVAPNGRFPTQIFEVARAIALIRNHADEWNCDKDRIMICGFSAGGHLCASYATLWNHNFVKETLGVGAETIRPNGAILCYPVIDSGEFAHRYSFECLLGERKDDAEFLTLLSPQKQVSADTPPMFIWHTFADDAVPVQNSLMMASALAAKNISVELHIFPEGGHGLSLADERSGSHPGVWQKDCTVWIDLAKRWAANL